MAMLEEMQMGMIVSMVVWDLVQETLKVIKFGDAVDMVVCNTFFKKEGSKIITYNLETIEV